MNSGVLGSVSSFQPPAVNWELGTTSISPELLVRLHPLRYACEDLIVGDFNGDKKPDIVASGRATRNIEIYWNESIGKGKP